MRSKGRAGTYDLFAFNWRRPFGGVEVWDGEAKELHYQPIAFSPALQSLAGFLPSGPPHYAIKTPPFLIPKTEDSEPVPFTPRAIYREFVKLSPCPGDQFTSEALDGYADFVGRYGFLGRGTVGIHREGESTKEGESVAYIRECVRTLTVVVSAYEAWRKSNVPALAKLIDGFDFLPRFTGPPEWNLKYRWRAPLPELFRPDFFLREQLLKMSERPLLYKEIEHRPTTGAKLEPPDWDYSPADPSPFDPKSPTHHGFVLNTAKELILSAINFQLQEGAAPALTMLATSATAKGRPPVIVPRDLLGSIWTSFAIEVMGYLPEPRICEACGRGFAPTNNRQRVCSSACRKKKWRRSKETETPQEPAKKPRKQPKRGESR